MTRHHVAVPRRTNQARTFVQHMVESEAHQAGGHGYLEDLWGDKAVGL